MTELPDGSLLLTADYPREEKLPDGKTRTKQTIAVWKSFDHGKRWQFPNPKSDDNTAVQDPDPNDPEAFAVNGFLLALPDGTVLIAYANGVNGFFRGGFLFLAPRTHHLV